MWLQRAPTSVDGEVLHRHRAGHLADVRQVLLVQPGGGAAHAAGLAVQSEETCGRRSSHGAAGPTDTPRTEAGVPAQRPHPVSMHLLKAS